ncbi:MAG TPA: dihydropteroate synthase [Azospirillaceae bacterium]|nr:dihydropteroate synthase [Azospirillaceae bacterium]
MTSDPSRTVSLPIRPLGLLSGEAARRAVRAGVALPLAGGPLAFTLAEVPVRLETGIARRIATPEELETMGEAAERALVALTAPRAAWAGFAPGRPLVMGVVNVTPDSFSDGGDHDDPAAAIDHGRALMAAGADILDIGGESTRPGAEPVAPEREAARVVTVIRALAAEGAVVSVDTRHAAVMRQALAAGARIVNDVSALAHDPESLAVVAEAGCPVVLMHMRGDPRTMQRDPTYDDVALDVYEHLASRIDACRAAGIPPERIAVDPGIGFGKTVEHNLDLLRHTALFHGLGCPVLVGVSRKRFIAALSRDEPPKERLGGSLAAGLAALDQGAGILRVHDVAATAQAVAMWRALHG